MSASAWQRASAAEAAQYWGVPNGGQPRRRHDPAGREPVEVDGEDEDQMRPSQNVGSEKKT